MTDITSRTLEKVKKCLALADSDNPGEAAAGLRQAQKLMEKYNLHMSDLRLAEVSETICGGVTKSKRLPAWVAQLRVTIGGVFGVDSLNRYYKKGGVYHNHAVFIGMGDKPEAAQYTYEVLFRQLTSDRNRYRESLDRRLPAATKTRRADLFCESWVMAVRNKVEDVAMDDKDREVVNRFREKQYGEIKEGKTRSHQPNVHDFGAIREDAEAGKKAQLFRGVGARAADQQIGG